MVKPTLSLSRRGLFGGAAALLAAPAIVRVASIMPVSSMPLELYGIGPLAQSLEDMRLYNEAIRQMLVTLNPVLRPIPRDWFTLPA